VCYMLNILLTSVAVRLGDGQPLILLIVVLISFMPYIQDSPRQSDSTYFALNGSD